MIGADGTPRRSVERGHERDLHTVLGEVQVTRLAYRAAGSENLYPADAQLNLPPVAALARDPQAGGVGSAAAAALRTRRPRSCARPASRSAPVSSES